MYKDDKSHEETFYQTDGTMNLVDEVLAEDEGLSIEPMMEKECETKDILTKKDEETLHVDKVAEKVLKRLKDKRILKLVEVLCGPRKFVHAFGGEVQGC